MSFDPTSVEAVAFDSYGTLVDVTAVEEPLSEHVEDPSAVATLWRNRSLQYAMVGNAIEEYDSFLALIEHALRDALHAHDVDLGASEREAILSAYHDLDVFDDVHEGIERLRDGGYDCYIVSNGDREMLDSLVEFADLDGLVEAAISADDVERFKPDAALYRHAADEIGVSTAAVAFVGAGWWDVPGAIHAGMQGVWINRQDVLWGPYETDPDLEIEAIGELADELDG